MNRHLSFRSGNPALTKNTFKNITYSNDYRMTLEGTVNKTIIALMLLLVSATYTFSNEQSFVEFESYIRLILLKNTKKRYLSKNNYNYNRIKKIHNINCP